MLEVAPPLIEKPPSDPAYAKPPTFTPGVRYNTAREWRWNNGMRWKKSPVTIVPVVEVSVSSKGVTEVTSTDSATAPTCMVAVTGTVAPTRMSMPSCTNLLKPGAVIVMRYAPGLSEHAEKSFGICLSRGFKVCSVLIALICAPDITAPLESWTCPERIPVSCAHAGTKASSISIAITATRSLSRIPSALSKV